MSWFRDHVERHRNPVLHVVVAVCSAVGALLLLAADHALLAVLGGLLSALNVAHAVAERRQPDPASTEQRS